MQQTTSPDRIARKQYKHVPHSFSAVMMMTMMMMKMVMLMMMTMMMMMMMVLMMIMTMMMMMMTMMLMMGIMMMMMKMMIMMMMVIDVLLIGQGTHWPGPQPLEHPWQPCGLCHEGVMWSLQLPGSTRNLLAAPGSCAIHPGSSSESMASIPLCDLPACPPTSWGCVIFEGLILGLQGAPLNTQSLESTFLNITWVTEVPNDQN